MGWQNVSSHHQRTTTTHASKSCAEKPDRNTEPIQAVHSEINRHNVTSAAKRSFEECTWCFMNLTILQAACRTTFTNTRGRSKSSRPDLVLFTIKLKYYLLIVVARLRTWHAQYDFWAINILCIFAYEHSVCQMDVDNANTKLYTSFWRTSQTIPTWPSKNLYHNSLLRMKRASATSILSQNNKAFNGTNESVKIVISLHCVTPVFACQMQTTDDC